MNKIFVKIPEISNKQYEVELDFEQNPSQLIEEFQEQILDKNQDYEIWFKNQSLKLQIPWNQQQVQQSSQVDIVIKKIQIILVYLVKLKKSFIQITKQTTVKQLEDQANEIFSVHEQAVLYNKGVILDSKKFVYEQLRDGFELEVRFVTLGGDQNFQ